MPIIEPISFYYTQADMVNALNNFSDKVKKGEAKEKLAYAIWRDLKACAYGVLVENWLDSAGRERLIFFESDPRGNKAREIANLLVYENAFALFFFEHCFLQHPDYTDEGDYDEMPIRYDYNTAAAVSNNTAYDYGLQYYNTTATNKETTINNNKKEKEKENMKGFNFDFGPCTGDNVRVSMYGIAVKNQNGEWVSYNAETAEIVNVDIFNFEGGKYIFKLPVAPKEVKVGDVIIHNKKAMFVIELDENGFIVVDVNAGEEKKVIPTKNLFNFDFITKIVSLFDFGNMGIPTSDNPFGNMWMFALMGENKEFNAKDMMMLSMMSSSNNTGMMNNPMMLMMLMDDKNDTSDLLIPMMMMNQNIVNSKN